MNDKLLNDINALTQLIDDYSNKRIRWNTDDYLYQRLKDITFILKQMRIEQLSKETTVKSYSDKEYQEAIDKAMEGD